MLIILDQMIELVKQGKQKEAREVFASQKGALIHQ